uniref:Uncharacterized protein n=1 Tax=Bracon brevicornis TaxID=1563983 RepID=A0A6V7KU14_9HYME
MPRNSEILVKSPSDSGASGIEPLPPSRPLSLNRERNARKELPSFSVRDHHSPCPREDEEIAPLVDQMNERPPADDEREQPSFNGYPRVSIQYREYYPRYEQELPPFDGNYPRQWQQPFQDYARYQQPPFRGQPGNHQPN